MPGFSDIYYFSSPQSRVHTTTVNTGKPNIGKFISSQPDKWNSNSTAIDKVPKNFLLNCWDINNWSNDKIEQFTQRYIKAVEEGFKFYYYDTSKVQELLLSPEDRNEIYQTVLLINRHQSYITHDEVSKHTNSSSKRWFILDDHGVESFITGKAITGRKIETHVLTEISEYRQNEILAYLKRSVPHVSEIISNENSKAAIELFSALKPLFPMAKSTLDYQYLRFDTEKSISEIMYKRTGKTNSGANISLSDLQKVNKKKIHGIMVESYTGVYSGRLMAQYFHTHKMNLYSISLCNDDLENKNLDNIGLEYCKELTLRVDQIHQKLLNKILPKCKHLQSLQLLCENAPQMLDLRASNLSRLQLTTNKEPKKPCTIIVKTLDELEINTCSFDLMEDSNNPYKELKKLSIPEGILHNDKIGMLLLQILQQRALYTIDIGEHIIKGLIDFKKKHQIEEILSLYNLQYFIGSVDAQPLELFLTLLPEDNQLQSIKSVNSLQQKLAPSSLKRLRNLREIHFQGTTYADAILQLAKDCPALQCINLKKVDYLSHSFLLSEDEFLKQMHAMNITVIMPEGENQSMELQAKPLEIVKHDPQGNEHNTPTAKDFKLEYRFDPRKLNQKFYIQQLTRYLTLKQKHLNKLASLNDGICNALSNLFIQESLQTWQQRISLLKQWDGRLESLNKELTDSLEKLYQATETFQSNTQPQYHYLGTDLQEFLLTNKEQLKKGCILNNPWHAISIKYGADDKWLIYDSNWESGYRSLPLEQLQKTITDDIGKLLSVTLSPNHPFKLPKIKLPDAIDFLSAGGLAILCEMPDSEQRALLIQHCLKSCNNSKAHEGLFLRTTTGVPFWAQALNYKHTQPLVVALLQAYLANNPQQKLQRLQNSIQAMPPKKRHEYLTKLIEITKNNQSAAPMVEKIRQSFHEASNKGYYLEKLATWNKYQQTTGSVDEYCQHLANSKVNGKKRLVELDSHDDLTAMQLALLKYCRGTKRPVFMANSAADLICSAPYIERNGQTGKLHKGPGGKLYEFLKANKNNNPAIIINYRNFQQSEVVQFNTIIDKERKADGIDLPENTLIVGLLDLSHPEHEQGSDFYSRFNHTEKCPITTESLQQRLPRLSVKEDKKAKGAPIDLYHAVNWKEILLGHWVLKGNDLVFHEGALKQALQQLKANEPLILANGLWDDEQFIEFWQHALAKAEIQYEGECIKIPPDLQVIKQEGYDFQALRAYMTPENKSPEHVINPSRLENCFGKYTCAEKTQAIYFETGLLEQSQNSVFSFILTRALAEDEWGRLLQEARKYNVRLDCHVVDGIDIPKDLQKNVQTIKKIPASKIDKEHIADTTVIQTVNPQQTNQAIADKGWKVIAIDEIAPSELLGGIDGKFDDKTLEFKFHPLQNQLTQWLDAGENVLLTGKFSNEWRDALAPLLMQRAENASQNKGKLVLTGQEMQAFSYHEPFEYPATPAVKTTEKPLKSQYSQNWRYDLTDSEQQTKEFKQQRLDAVLKALDKSPLALITGLTGVGKSTFMEDQLDAPPKRKVFFGEENITQWALDDSSDEEKILFIDEANLAHRDWSEFKGLFNNPPSMFHQGKYYLLSKKHKVVFAGNPSSYDEERKIPELFKEFDNEVEFTPMPAAMIYEDMLKGIVTKKEAQPLLDVYAYLSMHSTKEVLISPREVQMMALLLRSSKDYRLEQDNIALAQQQAFQMGATLVPANLSAQFAKYFDRGYGKTTLQPALEQHGDYSLTPSNRPVYEQLQGMLRLREYRRKAHKNEQIQYGGLNGKVITGKPGAGKSALVLMALLENGYKEVYFNPNQKQKLENSDNIFYRMPVSMSFEEKKALLVQAFNQGAVVIIDEINSSPMMERLINELLMGRYQNKRPVQPGFTIIGTQNPAHMVGRRQMSNALKRRLVQMDLPPYSFAEAMDIVCARIASPLKAKAMVEAFFEQSYKAERDNLDPEPTFRNLLDLVDEEVKATKRIEKLKQPDIEPECEWESIYIEAFEKSMRDSSNEETACLAGAKKLLLDYADNNNNNKNNSHENNGLFQNAVNFFSTMYWSKPETIKMSDTTKVAKLMTSKPTSLLELKDKLNELNPADPDLKKRIEFINEEIQTFYPGFKLL